MRRWAGDPGVVAASLSKLGMPDPWARKLKTITEVEKQIGKNKIDHVTAKTKPSLKVVEFGDKRAAVTFKGAEDDFDEI